MIVKRLRQRISPAALKVAGAGEQVVQRQAEPLFPRGHTGAGIKGQNETQWMNEVSRVVQ